ncbi:MAG TPA: hypothetical protein VG456_11685 [Candidatus Sulfopaludibacter sp.]|jgi:hypothetical protein|nr:hypothetical protein [Candidatus Sulfopaludibacter sp.]
MKYPTIGAALLSVAVLLAPATATAQNRTRNRNLNISMQGDAETCADLKVTSNGEVAQSADKFSMQRSEVAVLELNAADRGVIKVRGWSQSGYAVEACKIAVAEDRGQAERTLSAMTVSRSAGHFTFTGPQNDTNNWQVYFIVHVPANASLDLQTLNGPVSVAGVSGAIKARATNGPVSIKDCTGTIDAQSSNGPISFAGDAGEVKLQADNGPISVRLTKDIWNGSLLDARTSNGPLSLTLPPGFHSGVRVEASDGSPMSCRHDACSTAFRHSSGDKQTLQMNGSTGTVRVSTEHGPISVGSDKKAL